MNSILYLFFYSFQNISIMKKSLPARSRSKSQSKRRVASSDLVQFIKKQYPTRIPITMITGISKLYCKNKPVTRQSKIIKRVAQSATHVHTAKFIESISNDQTHKKGAPLTEDTIKKIYQGFCNPQGKLSFQYLMKMSQQTGSPINEKLAKAIVKKYGKRKDFLNLQDCQRVLKRRYDNISRKLSPRLSPRSNKIIEN